MTDEELIQGLISRDNLITEQFFYVKCRPLLTAIMRIVFDYHVEYNEMVSELYNYLMEDDGLKLRQFEFRSSVYQWMKVVATRFFIRRRNFMIENFAKSPHYERVSEDKVITPVDKINDRMDVEKLLQIMDNKRYADVIRSLILNEESPEQYAMRMGVTVDNLYNIKKRAITAFSQIAIKYYDYER